MTAPTSIETDVAREQAAEAARAWNETYPSATPVLYWLAGDRTKEPLLDATAYKAYVPGGWDPSPMVSLRITGQHVRLSHLQPNPDEATVAGALRALKVPEIDFPPPPCSVCETVDCEHDGDRFRCPQCGASWSNPYEGSRPCVECGTNYADGMGADGQPRCRGCHTEVRANVIDATEPYQCKRCDRTVTGIGMQSPGDAYKHRLCGGCREADQRRESLDAYFSKRAG